MASLSSLVCHKLLVRVKTVHSYMYVCQCIFISLTVLGATYFVLVVSMQLEDLINAFLSTVLGKSGKTFCHDHCIAILSK